MPGRKGSGSADNSKSSSKRRRSESARGGRMARKTAAAESVRSSDQEESNLFMKALEAPVKNKTVHRSVRETAETMAAKQKDIAVSEFFAKNRHLLGFDNPRKALLTSVKEAVDNSLDACEEA